MATHPLLPASAAVLALLAACGVGRDVATAPDAGSATAGAACTRCHGSGDDPAPPRSARGETSTTALGVGAHQAHLKDGVLHRAFACAECHVVPTDTKHVDGVAKVAFGATANAAGVTSTWDRGSATCATYCHGATLPGGTLTTPLWTGGSSQATCGSCHGAPPPAPHPQVADCGTCHQGYGRDFVNPVLHVDGKVQVGGSVTGACGSCHAIPPPAPHTASTQCGSCHPGYTSTSVVAATHQNGVVDLAMSCTSCHGDATRATNPAAPPADSKGNTATTARGVGAHQSHLGSRLLAAPVACSECHVVPSSPSHSSGTVDVTFGALARSGGAAASWDGTSLTCAVYCHGATLNAGGTATAPVWTRVDGTQKTCGSCHGAPPPAPHTQSTACGSCHAGYTATSVNAATHLNGTLEVSSLSCTSCHGDATRASNPIAPPRDTKGNTATTARGVGAHQSHLNSTLRTGSVACTDCHVLPTSTAHANGTATVTFGGTATLNGQSPAWNTTALSCSATACHASTLTTGGTARTPVWTTVNGSQKTCGSCHGAPPSSGHHTSVGSHQIDCVNCHGSGYSATAATVNPALHLDGVKNVGGAGSRINSWNPATRSCAPACHGTKTW